MTIRTLYGIDIGEGLMYKSHPELLRKGTWSHEIAKAEVKRCRDVGIEIIPKRNFSATHHTRLVEYGRMMSTSIISTTISPGGFSAL